MIGFNNEKESFENIDELLGKVRYYLFSTHEGNKLWMANKSTSFNFSISILSNLKVRLLRTFTLVLSLAIYSSIVSEHY